MALEQLNAFTKCLAQNTLGEVESIGIDQFVLLLLPREGDQRLSLILSKAILLADDKKISDPTISTQIES